MADNFDKFRPDWTVGTLTLTGGSTAFTATDAELILAAIREGDAIITPTGFFLPIETLAEDGLSGTLSNPAPSASAGTFDTRIRYQSDNSRFTGALLALTRQLTGGNLQSFGNLEGLQDLMPIFLGPGSVGLINKSEVGIQDPNGTLAKFAALTRVANRVFATNGASDPILATIAAILGYTPADRAGDTFTGAVVSNSRIQSRQAKPNPVQPGDQIYGGQIISSFQTDAGVNPFINLRLREVVNSNVYALLHVAGYGANAYFNFSATGGLQVPGALTAGSKSFKIDHVKDPYNKYLVYMSTEAPKAGIEDWGSIRLLNGQAEVDLDIAAGQMSGTFAALTQRAVVVSVNNLDSYTRVRAGRITDSKFTIFADDPDCDDEVTWLVKAERADPFIKSHPYCDPVTGLLIPEHEKED